MAGYSNYWFHFEASFLNWGVWLGIAVGSILIAGVERLLPGE